MTWLFKFNNAFWTWATHIQTYIFKTQLYKARLRVKCSILKCTGVPGAGGGDYAINKEESKFLLALSYRTKLVIADYE